MRLGEKENVNYEAVTTALRKAVRLNCAIQACDGHWPAECGGAFFLTPPLASVVTTWTKKMSDLLTLRVHLFYRI